MIEPPRHFFAPLEQGKYRAICVDYPWKSGLVAAHLGRNATLIELNPDSIALARRRIAAAVPLLAEAPA